MQQNQQVPIFRKGKFAFIRAYETRDGRVILRPTTNEGGHDIRTLDTQKVRLLWPNLIKAGKAVLPVIHNAFGKQKPGRSDYNDFVSKNFDEASVYLTKRESEMGACVMENFYVSQGELEPVGLEKVDGMWVSDICVGDLVIDENTTLQQFALAINNANPGRFAEGTDSLALVRVKQHFSSVDEMPRVRTVARKLDLEVGSETTIRVLDAMGSMGADGLQIVERQGLRYLAFSDEGAGSLVTYIHAHTHPDRSVSMSTQRLMGASIAEEDGYKGPMALYRAIESYGGLTDNNWYRFGAVLDPMQELLLEAELEGTTPADPEEDGTGNTGPTEEEGGSTEGGGQGGQTPSTVDITVACADPMSGTPYGGGQLVPGTEQQIGVTPNFNWNFIQWNDGDTHNPRTITVPNSNTTYTATLQLQDQQKSQQDQLQ